MNKKLGIILTFFFFAAVLGVIFVWKSFSPSSRITESDKDPILQNVAGGESQIFPEISADSESAVESVLLKPAPTIEKLIKYDVPFVSQAPLGEWDDLRQQNACEEASALMAMKWARGESIASLEQAKEEILDIVDFQVKTHNFHYDTSTRDTVEIIYKGYFKYNKVKVVENAAMDDIKRALAQGSLVVVAANGQLLDNPFYTQPGPLEHMLVIIGYNPKTKEYITNDPGTKRGKNYRYDEDILYRAIRDYPTGYQEPITKIEKLLIVVEK